MLKRLLVIVLLCLSSSFVYAQSVDVCEQIALSSLEIDAKNLDDSTLESALVAYESGDYSSAEEFFTELIGQDVENANLYLYRGCVLAGLEEYEDAYSDVLIYIGLSAFDMSDDVTNGIDELLVDSSNLTRTETADSSVFEGTVSVSYPAGWFIAGEGGSFLISNNEKLVETKGLSEIDEIPEGTVIITVTIVRSKMASAMGIETPTVVIEKFSPFFEGKNYPTFDVIEELTIDGNVAARAISSNDKIASTLYAINKSGNFTLGFGGTASDEAEANAELIQAIIASVIFIPYE